MAVHFSDTNLRIYKTGIVLLTSMNLVLCATYIGQHYIVNRATYIGKENIFVVVCCREAECQRRPPTHCF